jgi:hypothetical protein
MGRRTPLTALITLAALLVGALVGSTGAASAEEPSATGSWRPPGHTIVRVTGDAANGFTVHRFDGTALHPPTHSESMAECGEYHRAVARVRCRTEVRVWYRDLAATKTAINWARYDARR